MTKEEILSKLKEHKSYIQERYGVKKIGLFGSYARNEAKEESDVDIYVEFNEISFSKIAGLWNYLEDLYHKKIDLVRGGKLRKKSAIMDVIQKETIYI